MDVVTNATQVWPIGIRKQLLFDRRFVESSAGLQRTVNPPLQCTPINLPSLPGLQPSCHYLRLLDVGIIAGRPVRMRITMRSAKLYAFQFSEDSK